MSDPGYPVWANGRLVPAGTPVVEAEDQGFLYGLAVFDTVLCESGRALFVEEHVRRLERGAREVGIPWPPRWDPALVFEEVARSLEGATAVLRMTLSLGVPGGPPTLFVTCRAVVPPPAEGVRVWVSSHRKDPGLELEHVKSTNRMRNVLAREEARAHGAWEALLRNAEGDLSEGTVSNLFVVHEGVLRTPSEARGALGGITREKLLSSLAAEPLLLEDGATLVVEQGRVEPRQVLEASEVFLSNTSGRVIGVLSVGGLEREVSGLPGPRGPVTHALRERMRAIEAADLARGPGRA